MRMFESTKVLSIMQGLAVWHLFSAKPEGSVQLCQGLRSGLFILRLPRDNVSQFISKHGANTGSALSRESSCSLQDLFVDRKRDVLLHKSALFNVTRKIREGLDD